MEEIARVVAPEGVNTAPRSAQGKGKGSLAVEKETLRVLFVTEGLSADLGGTAVVVQQIADHLADAGIAVTVVALGRDGKSFLGERRRFNVIECGPSGWQKLGFAPALGRTLDRLPAFDVVHIHGLWLPLYWQAAAYARKRAISTTLSTHGMLEPSALRRSRFVKWVARPVYQDAILQRVDCLHTTAPHEARSLRGLGFRRPIAVIPWGVSVPAHESGGDSPHSLIRRTVNSDGVRVALFLSRIHPIKGLDVLLKAWAQVRREFGNWVLVIAGYDEDGYRAEIFQLAAVLGLGKSVFSLGPLEGEEKEAAFATAELFVLPSHSENFGLVVAEALAREVPVITTKGTPWSAIVEHKCGWWIDQGVEPLAAALRAAMNTGAAELQAMGRRGRALVREQFSLTVSGDAFGEMYEWLARRRGKPSFVLES